MEGMRARERYLRWALLGLSALAIWLTQGFPFFWDSIQLGSKHAHWYYEQGFRYLLPPSSIDSGHPPLFGLYLAGMWQLFGKSLAVSHWAMLPVVWGTLWLLFPIGRYWSRSQTEERESYGWLFPLLALANPVLLAQLLLISPDAVLVLGFLMVLYGILYRNRWPKTFGALLLAGISTRGMMVVVVLYVWELLNATTTSGAASERPPAAFPSGWRTGLLRAFRLALPYVPSGLLALAYLSYHYWQAGWIGYHADSPWAPGFEKANALQMLRNLAVLAWRLLDFGLVFVWLALGIAAWRIWRKALPYPPERTRLAFSLFGVSLALLSLSWLLHVNLHQHRYLLPVMLALQMLAFTLIVNSGLRRAWKTALLALMLLGPISGHFWVYPDYIAQGWDSSLAHLPYYRLKAEMIDHLDAKGIPLEKVGTTFPEIGPQYLKQLNGRREGFRPKDLSKQQYILYSNVMSDFSDADIAELQSDWRSVKRLESGGVKLVLYRKP